MVNPVIPATDFFLAIFNNLPQPITALFVLSCVMFAIVGLIRLLLR